MSGVLEDRFFATVFLGSALLFLAMLCAGAAIIGAIVLVAPIEANTVIDSTTFHFARAKMVSETAPKIKPWGV